MVDSAYAEWLQQGERQSLVTDAALAGRWGALGETREVSSAFDVEASAIAEANRQLAFYGSPLVQENVIVRGVLDIAAIRGRVWTVTIAASPAYAGGVDVFVLGGSPDHGVGSTTLFVLRRL